eukprot:748781_1
MSDEEDEFEDIEPLLVSGWIRNIATNHGKSVKPMIDPIIEIISKYISEPEPLIIDHGSAFIRAGFSGVDKPQVTIPTNNPGDIDTLFHNVFSPQKMNIGKDFHGLNVLITEPPLNPKSRREKVTKLMFETYNANGLYIAIDAVLALYSSGRTSGSVFQSGYDASYCVPIYEGYVLPHCITKLEVGGKHVSDYLGQILAEKGYSFNEDIIRYIKENLCYISLNDTMSWDNELDKEYELPDGKCITIGSELSEAAEIMFHPDLIGVSGDGVHKMIYDSISKIDFDLSQRYMMYTNIVLSGGNTLFKGFEDRLRKKISALTSASIKMEIIAFEYRQNSTWIGG